MKRLPVLGSVILSLALTVAVAPTPLAAGQLPGTPLTGPAGGTPEDIARNYLAAHQADLGLSGGDLADLVVKDRYVSQHNGVTHVYLQQRLGGIEVVNGIINANVMSDGRLLNLGNRFVSNLAKAVNTRSPAVSADAAIRRAAEHLGVDLRSSLDLLEVIGGPAMEAVYSGAGISHDDIPAKLMYLPLRDGGGVRLVWSLVIRQTNTSDWWNLFVDAVNGEVLDKLNWTRSESYEVFALPKESPLNGPRTIEVDPFDLAASPFGWHDTDGVAGPEFTDTRGNNVEAQTDLDANNAFTPGTDVRAEGGPTLDFTGPAVPLDLDLPPSSYREAAVANLFYYNNIMHDVTYQYGFDEPAGNFQENTYGNGGAGGDPVQADAQDGSGCNNANFGTPPDGADPRMQMFVWQGDVENATLTVNTPPEIAGDYVAGKGCWGGSLDPPTTADLELVDDGDMDNPTQGCNDLIGFTPGNVALIDRGNCEFGTKALKAEEAGAVGAIIVNDQQLPNDIIAMGAGDDGGSVTIPSVMIGNADGLTIRAELPGVNGTIGADTTGGNVDRDSDLDNGIIGHEYGHGISNRLVGGPAQAGCLGNAEQMGEGLSDFWTLVLTALPGDTAEMARGIGNYASFLPPDGPGIRNFPYSTDLAVNPETYADVATTNVPHGVGSIWMIAVWEMYWNLVDKYGFDADFYSGTGGNNLSIQLVIDGMKMTACSPSFVDGRDGILAADVAANGGANLCEIWSAFAKRGVGFSADAGDPNVLGDETEAFDLPPFCVTVGGLPDSLDICQGDTATYVVGVGTSFASPPVTMSSSGEPAGTTSSFTPNPVPGPLPTTTAFEVSGTAGAAPGAYTITLTGTAGADVFNADVALNVFAPAPAAPQLTAPADGAVDQLSRPTFEWLASADALSYTLEVDDDPGFGSIDYSVSGLTGTTHTPTIDLQFGTTYSWRVTSVNPCGAGPSSTVFSFTTQDSPALCPPNLAPQALFDDDLESGAAGWTSGGTGDTWGLSGARTTSGANAFYAVDSDTLSDQQLVSPPIVLPMGESPLTLQFQNYQAFETPNGDGRCWDAGILEVTTDAGASWAQVPGTAMLTDPYDNVIWDDTPGNNPISLDYPGGAEAWCDVEQPFLESVVDIDAYAGDTVQFRWRLGSDGNTGNEGWYLDDVVVQSCVDATIFTDGFESGNTSAWSNTVP